MEEGRGRGLAAERCRGGAKGAEGAEEEGFWRGNGNSGLPSLNTDGLEMMR
jgi:hypothetical protein